MAQTARVHTVEESSAPHMTPAQRRYLVLEQGVGAAVFNAVLNAAIAWGLNRGKASVPMWGMESIAGDTFVTAFVLAVLTVFIATAVTRSRMRGGTLDGLAWERHTHGIVRWKPPGLAARAIFLGLACMATAAPLMIGVLVALGVEEMSLGTFILFKAAFAGVLAAVVTPVVAVWAMTDPN